MRSSHRYLKINVLIFLCGMTGFVVANALIDPEGRFSLLARPRFNQEKTEIMESGGRTPKSRALAHGLYDTLILGSSRTENGIDPRHEVFASKRAYNAALSGSNFYETYQVFEFARKNAKLTTVLIGLDFLLFSSKRDVSGDFFDSGFAGRPPWLSDLRYLASPQTFWSAWTTVQKNRSGEQSLYTDRGMRDRTRMYAPARVNHRELFIKILSRDFLVSQKTYGGFEYGLDRVDLLRAMIAECRRDGISLYLFIPPSHARDLEALQALGLYPLFEQWKRDLTQIVAEDNGRHPAARSIPLWDFSGYTSITIEDIPAANEKGKAMRWYWESSHFKKETGDLVLDRLFGHERPSRSLPEDFGVLLSPQNIEAHLAWVRGQQQRYRETHSHEVAEVEDLVRITARFRSVPRLQSTQVVTRSVQLPQPAAN
ncbi:MAG: hypothetical protein HYZ50_19030 [Deltaproteobacteria bacterium]|nr:hypothetical protein [Deltaproteobacteria bacterium]